MLALLPVLCGAFACAAGMTLGEGSSAGTMAVELGAFLPGSHSHNDFERRRPLIDALRVGVASIEVDVALRDGVFYVTHDSADIRVDRTLVGMYLDPLLRIAEINGGFIYPAPAPPLQLLVDVKSEAGTAYEALELLLSGFDGLVTRWSGDNEVRGAVSVVISGNRATDIVRARTERRVALDGRIWEDRSGASPSLVPMVSINWDDTTGPRGHRHMPERMANAQRFIETVHAEGRRVRFWDTPDRPEIWAELIARGTDYIGVDDIGRLARFLRQ